MRKKRILLCLVHVVFEAKVTSQSHEEYNGMKHTWHDGIERSRVWTDKLFSWFLALRSMHRHVHEIKEHPTTQSGSASFVIAIICVNYIFVSDWAIVSLQLVVCNIVIKTDFVPLVFYWPCKMATAINVKFFMWLNQTG